MITSAPATGTCSYCGAFLHTGMCPRIKAIEYHESGGIKRVELWSERAIQLSQGAGGAAPAVCGHLWYIRETGSSSSLHASCARPRGHVGPHANAAAPDGSPARGSMTFEELPL